MSNLRIRSIFWLLPVVIIMALPAHATTISYADLTSWQAATSTQTAIPFSGKAAAGSFVDYSSTTGLVISGVTFLGYLSPTAFMLDIFDQAYASPYYNFGASADLVGPQNNQPSNATFLPYIHVALPANTTAFSTNLSTASPNGIGYQITLSDGTSFSVATPSSRPNTAFFGVTSTSPILSVDFTLTGTTYQAGTQAVLTNFEIGTAGSGGAGGGGQTPELLTLTMIGGGLLFIRGLRKYRKLLGFVHA